MKKELYIMSHYMARGCHRTGVKRGGGNRQNDFVVIDGEEGTCSIVVSTNRMCALYISSSYLKKKKNVTKGIERK